MRVQRGSFPIAHGTCMCVATKMAFRSVELRNYFDTCGVGSNRGPQKKPPPYLSAARQEPSPTSGHLTSRWAILSTRTRKFGPERMFIQTCPAHFPTQFSNTPNTRMPPPRRPWATRPINACCPKCLPLVLGVEGAGGVCSKSKLSTTHNHHYRRRCYAVHCTTPAGEHHNKEDL